MGGLNASSMNVDGTAASRTSDLEAMLTGGAGVMTTQVGREGGAAHWQAPPSQQEGNTVALPSSAGLLA